MVLAKDAEENNTIINIKWSLIMSKNTSPIIETKNLGKTVAVADGDLSILASVDLTINRGESIAIVGGVWLG